MKKLMLSLSLAGTFFLASASAANTNGESIFEAKACNLCHKPDMDTVGPSLKTIAMAYLGKEATLISYFQGQAAPIVDPVRASVMNPQLVKIRTLFDEDMKDLADYIISASDRPF